MPEGLADAVIPGIEPLIAAGDRRRRHSGALCDFIDETLIDEPPAKALCKMVREVRAAATIFTFHGDDSNHGDLPLLMRKGLES
jgi:hypothetical protein